MSDLLLHRARRWHTGSAYSGEDLAAKKAFHSAARASLRQLARDLNLSDGQYDIRTNMGGMAVTGETTLHTDHLYVQVQGGFGSRMFQVMYRTCKGRKDYCGGANNFCALACLADNRMHSAAAALLRREAV